MKDLWDLKDLTTILIQNQVLVLIQDQLGSTVTLSVNSTGHFPEGQGQNLVLTVLCVASPLDSGRQVFVPTRTIPNLVNAGF